ncbi:hypothetical protein B0T17DRAFT_497692 [Bombardia bombarda]|uniref:Rhodopsin domain-containing protein n=1 Tax=Bombardia bombarda TaxID=252184 RepID=A0AA40BVL1_9PEZI|nr:hypothetical protein B0T17DRAFT_497692 [Bombardia bombarda]
MSIPYDTPSIPPPPGIVSDFVDPPSYHAVTMGVGIASCVIMTVSVGIRTWTKAVILRDMRHEDYVALVALIGFLAWGIIYMYLSHLGLTRDLWNIRAVDLSYLLYLANVFQLVYPWAMLAAKYFVLIQLERIFCPSGFKNSVYWIIKGMLAATFGYYIGCFFLFLFQCVPREKIWNPAIEGTCVNNNGAVLSAGLINLFLDLGILFVPIFAIWRLQMSIKRKLGVMSIFAVGIAFAELVGTIVVGCMPTFPRFFDYALKEGGPLSLFYSIRPTVGSGFRSRESKSNRNQTEEESRITAASAKPSKHREVVTDEYIELHDGESGHKISQWPRDPHEAV